MLGRDRAQARAGPGAFFKHPVVWGNYGVGPALLSSRMLVYHLMLAHYLDACLISYACDVKSACLITYACDVKSACDIPITSMASTWDNRDPGQ